MPLLDALGAGALLAAGFNPVVALIGAVVTACLLATQGGLRRSLSAWSLLVASWLVGDGMRVVAGARNLSDGAGALLPAHAVWVNWTALVVWGVLGLLLGYAAPAWAGAFVGRRVTWGTGWLAAGAVAVAVSFAVAGAAGALR